MEERSLGPSADDKLGPPSKLFGGSEMATGYTMPLEGPWDEILDKESTGTIIVVM